MISNHAQTSAPNLLKDLTSITTFPTKFIVEESLVKDYLEHLQNLDLRKQVHTQTAQRKRQAEREKSYDAYDWVGLSKEGKLGKLSV